jgi:purine nucleoside phosphorylase
MEGPAFSTVAESNLHRAWGGSVIGMTAVGEAKLCREAEISYAVLAMATDYDCWKVRAIAAFFLRGSQDREPGPAVGGHYHDRSLVQHSCIHPPTHSIPRSLTCLFACSLVHTQEDGHVTVDVVIKTLRENVVKGQEVIKAAVR